MTTIKERLIRVFASFLLAMGIMLVSFLLPLSVSSYTDFESSEIDKKEFSIEATAHDETIDSNPRKEK